jgi:dynein heavy chain
MGLQMAEGFLRKVTEVRSLLTVRHCVMLLGGPGTGKTSMWKALHGCLNLGLPRPTALVEVVSPKCVSTDELYGHMTLARVREGGGGEGVGAGLPLWDVHFLPCCQPALHDGAPVVLTRVVTSVQEWIDGILSGILRNMSKKLPPYTPLQTAHWVVFDGDIDVGWIEVGAHSCAQAKL